MKTRIFNEHFPIGGRSGSTTVARLRAVLPFKRRQQACQQTRAMEGDEIRIELARGTILRAGDLLRAADGTLLEIVAAPEYVSTVITHDSSQLARVAYHLGSRQVALQIGPGWVRYLFDHVLDVTVARLGLDVTHSDETFEPEPSSHGSHASSSHSHSDRERHRGSFDEHRTAHREQ